MVKRLGVVLVAIAATLLSLTACQNKANQAASIDGQVISESTLSTYVVSGAQAYQQPDSSTGQSYTVVPKHEALQVLILDALFDKVFASHGGVPTSAEIDAELNKDVTNAQRASITSTLLKDGYTQRYLDLTLAFQGKIGLLTTALKDDSSNTKLVAALRALKAKVSVNPRYGTWDATSLALNENGSIPSFVKLTTAAAQSAS